MEFENDLIKLLTKLHEKRLNNRGEDSDIIAVNVKNNFDLRQLIEEAERYTALITKDKISYNNTLTNTLLNINNKVSRKNEYLNKLKEQLENVIEKSSIIQLELNNKKNEEISVKASYDSITPEYENMNYRILDNIKKETAMLNDKTQNMTNINYKLKSISNRLKKRDSLIDSFYTTKENSNHNQIEYKILDKENEESEHDFKFLNAIKINLKNNEKDIKSFIDNTTDVMKNLSQIIDEDNNKKLQIEKDQLNEQYQDNRKNYKKYLTEHEEIEYEIQDLMKKKNKLKNKFSEKEIEDNLNSNNVNDEIIQLEKSIKKSEAELVAEFKNHQEVNNFKSSMLLTTKSELKI
jgi:hypothetical protein